MSMKTAIILHGMPSESSYFDATKEAQSNSHWLPWLQQQLLVKGVLAQTPELPNPYRPVYEDWKHVFEQFEVTKDTILVGHSCGAGFLVRWLSENKVPVGRVALVAPWMDPHRTLGDFFNFTIDKEVHKRAEKIELFISEDDDEEMQIAVREIKEIWMRAPLHAMTGHGHFTLKDMGTREFPELLGALLN